MELFAIIDALYKINDAEKYPYETREACRTNIFCTKVLLINRIVTSICIKIPLSLQIEKRP